MSAHEIKVQIHVFLSMMLHIHSLGAQAFSNAFFGQGVDPIWMDNVFCAGREAKIIDCPLMTGSTSLDFHNEDAGIRCLAKGEHNNYHLQVNF